MISRIMILAVLFSSVTITTDKLANSAGGQRLPSSIRFISSHIRNYNQGSSVKVTTPSTKSESLNSKKIH